MTVPLIEPTDPPPGITQPDAPAAPTQESFKCEKCGATFEDESSAAAHIQECKGTDVIPIDRNEPQKS